jgi:hypothetical protein
MNEGQFDVNNNPNADIVKQLTPNDRIGSFFSNIGLEEEFKSNNNASKPPRNPMIKVQTVAPTVFKNEEIKDENLLSPTKYRPARTTNNPKKFTRSGTMFFNKDSPRNAEDTDDSQT